MNLTQKLFNKFNLEYELNKRNLSLLEFAGKAFFYDFSKLLILFLFALVTHQIAAFFLDTFLLILLRNSNGGIHLKHYWSCFLLSFFIIAFSIIIPQHLIFPKSIMLLLLLVCIFVNYMIGPLPSRQCRIKDRNIFSKGKINSFFIVFLYMTILFFFPVSPLLASGFYIIVFLSLQLVIEKFLRIYTERKKIL